MLFGSNEKKLNKFVKRYKFDKWIDEISEEDLSITNTNLDQILESTGNSQICPINLIPSSWCDSEWYAVYKACNKNVKDSVMFLSMLLWQSVTKQSDKWYCYQDVKNDYRHIIYFRKTIRVKNENKNT